MSSAAVYRQVQQLALLRAAGNRFGQGGVEQVRCNPETKTAVMV
jgi:hypothetical protein